MDKEYNTLYFLNKLDIWQAREIFRLALLDSHFHDTESIQGIDLEDVTVENIKSDRDKNAINGEAILHRTSSENERERHFFPFIMDDFTLTISDYIRSKDLSPVLHMYLANQFGEAYIDGLYKKRLADALIEKRTLLESTSKKSEETAEKPVFTQK